jgi:hypothetical protein
MDNTKFDIENFLRIPQNARLEKDNKEWTGTQSNPPIVYNDLFANGMFSQNTRLNSKQVFNPIDIETKQSQFSETMQVQQVKTYVPNYRFGSSTRDGGKKTDPINSRMLNVQKDKGPYLGDTIEEGGKGTYPEDNIMLRKTKLPEITNEKLIEEILLQNNLS